MNLEKTPEREMEIKDQIRAKVLDDLVLEFEQEGIDLFEASIDDMDDDVS